MTNPKPEPVAWLLERKPDHRELDFRPLTADDARHGWTETPLYPASALEEAYRRGQEDMRERAAVEAWGTRNGNLSCMCDCEDCISQNIRALEINP